MEDIKLRSLRDRQKATLNQAENFLQNEIAGTPPLQSEQTKKQKKLAKKIAKSAAVAAFVFIVGGIGGVWTDRVLLPNLLVKYPQLSRYELLKNMNERTTIIRETEDIKISQEEAISAAIEKVNPAIVQVLVKTASGQFESTGSAIILTSDGYIITPLQNTFAGAARSAEIQVKLKNGKVYPAQVSAQDTDYSVAMLKISENNLPVIPYANSDDLKLGQKLIIMNDTVSTDIISKFIDNYKMPGSTDSSFQKRIQITQNLAATSAGSAVINLEGRLVGVEQDANIVIPLSEIKSFIDKSTAK